jgi:hypothetical protein
MLFCSCLLSGYAAIPLRGSHNLPYNSIIRSFTKVTEITQELALGGLVITLSSMQKNLDTAKHQLKGLSSHSAEEIRSNAALRLKAAQLEVTLLHIFEEGELTLDKNQLSLLLSTLSQLKKPV